MPVGSRESQHDELVADQLVVDLSTVVVATEEAFWTLIAAPLGLPPWFGRNLNAWIDTIEGGNISDVVDDHGEILIRVRRRGLFEPANERGRLIVAVTEDDTRARFEFIE